MCTCNCLVAACGGAGTTAGGGTGGGTSGGGTGGGTSGGGTGRASDGNGGSTDTISGDGGKAIIGGVIGAARFPALWPAWSGVVGPKACLYISSCEESMGMESSTGAVSAGKAAVVSNALDEGKPAAGGSIGMKSSGGTFVISKQLGEGKPAAGGPRRTGSYCTSAQKSIYVDMYVHIYISTGGSGMRMPIYI